MKLSQSVVKRMMADEEFRARAIANPESALSEYDLPKAEKQSLMALCRKMASHGAALAIAATVIAQGPVEPLNFWM